MESFRKKTLLLKLTSKADFRRPERESTKKKVALTLNFVKKTIDLSNIELGLIFIYSSQNLNFESYMSGEKMPEEFLDFEKKVEAAI